MIMVDAEARKKRQLEHGGRPKCSEEKKDAIITDYNAGMPVRKIAKKHGITTTTIYRFVKERSLE